MSSQFFKQHSPIDLVKQYGSPVYVYSEDIFRARCREMKSLVTYPNFHVNYSVKANTNLTLLKIANEEGLHVDAMSPGEIYIEEAAGFTPDKIFFISNNVSAEEMKFAVERGITISVDSLSQLKLLGEINPGGKVAVRLNPGVGAGHHEKVVTGGKKTKFAIQPEAIDEIKALVKQYDLKLVGINQHIGSLFLEPESYIAGVQSALHLAKQFDDLEFIDLGGGFGIPYNKGLESRLDLKSLGAALDKLFYEFSEQYGKMVTFKIEPGRYIVAESGTLLGTVHAIKEQYGIKYAGTDLGFNVLQRPVMYDSYHEVQVFPADDSFRAEETVTIVGNICESGDILAKDRILPAIKESDVLAVLDAGAYGFAMASNYNQRLRPAEILIRENGEVVVIRRRDTLEDLMRNFE